MTNIIVCPGCGRSASIEVGTAGRAVCPGCGKSLTRYLNQIQSSQSPPARSEIDLRSPSPTEPTAARAQRTVSNATLITATSVAGLCLLAGAVFVGYSLRGNSFASGSSPAVSPADATWEQEHRSEFYTLKADAEARVLAGDLKGGHEKYRELQLLAGSHPVHDPALFDLLQDARSSQERVYGMLLTKQETAMGYFNPANENQGSENQGVVPPATQPAASATPSAPPPQYPAVTGQQQSPSPTAATSPAVVAVVPPTSSPAIVPQPQTAAPEITPALPPAAVFAGHEADRQIGLALDRGIEFLISKFNNGQVNDGLPRDSIQHQGLDALFVYALLNAGQASTDPRLSIHGPFMTDLIHQLKSFRLDTDATKPIQPVVYARSLRAAALAVYDRADDRTVLRADVAWLIKATTDGAYTYDDRYSNPSPASPLGTGSRTPIHPPEEIEPNGKPERDTGFQPVLSTKGLATAPGELIPNCGHGLEARVTTHLPAAQDQSTAVQTAAMVDLPAGTQLADNGERVGPILRPPPPPLVIPTQPPAKYDPLQSDTQGPQNYPQNPGPPPWDNSNSQYGLLGVWSGAEAGVEVPTAYWKAVEKHWLGCELATGQWFYSNTEQRATLSMTCAGIASLLVTHEWLDAPALGTRVGRPPYSPALTQGLHWLETGDNVNNLFTPDLRFLGYTAYGIERCALASGFKFFGTHDWYTEIARQILPHQAADGSWGPADSPHGALIDTPYIVLFLTRGRHPVMMNKLRVEPFWDNRPRDLANLAKFASRELEHPLNWQVVSFERPWFDWMDAPILYIASHQQMNLSDEDINKLRSYAEAGGLLFTHADSGSAEFNTFAADLAKKLWPQYPMQDMRANHELFSVNYHLSNPPKLKMVTNGSRIFMVHSPTDLSPAWQERMTHGRERETFQFGVNLFIWAAGRSNFRNRLDSPYIAEPTTIPSSTIKVARLKHDGNWDPEPYAWIRFGRYMQWTTGIAVKRTTVELNDLKPGDATVAVLTGNTPATFTDAEVTATKAFVESGGTLLIDACGGSEPFAKTVETQLLAKAFATPPTPVAATDPLVADGQTNVDNLTKPALRGYAAETLGKSEAPPVQVLTFGKGKVIFSRLDLTTGLLGTNSWGINGYTPGYCEAFVKNALLTAAR